MTVHTPTKRLGEARDLDGVVLLLAFRASTFIAGSSIVIDGGHSICRQIEHQSCR